MESGVGQWWCKVVEEGGVIVVCVWVYYDGLGGGQFLQVAVPGTPPHGSAPPATWPRGRECRRDGCGRWGGVGVAEEAGAGLCSIMAAGQRKSATSSACSAVLFCRGVGLLARG